ncbi:DUF4406 domain-containing protein [Flavobacterium sp.]|uniref:DUF4406 domain-containing protein n=1 Tax=Flavobacterium sp. TaxID=239 RepID=UPI003751AE37
MKKKIYIAGKVTGEPTESCRAKFAATQQHLEAFPYDFKVVNPMVLITDVTTPWHEAMDICLTELKKCDAIYIMPCSIDSPGAQLELQYAIDYKLDIYYELE